jgi:steroid 5-alpha reductase family enzyme
MPSAAYTFPMAPLIASIWVFAAICLVVWVTSLITREYSWVDRIWSVIPIVYVWIFAGAAGFTDLRLDLLAVVVTLWGARLTFNFSRKGGYAPGGEDYRWAILRARMKPWQFQVFNLFFITIYQNVILLLITLPAFMMFEHRATPFGLLDGLLFVIFLAFLVGETVADQQQWAFHQWKKAEQAAGRDARPRFLQTGLFRFSRHPNFFFEQAQWWVVFFIGATAAGSVLQWTVAGSALLTLLFIGSTVFTESITLSKYPEYAGYKKRTSALIPWFPGKKTDVQVPQVG